MTEKKSVQVLREAIELQLKKSQDYQNPRSTVKQADYYPHGMNTIMDIVKAKTLRIQSLLEAAEFDNYKPNHEGIYDSCVDAINYLSFAAAYLSGEVDGQVPGRDIFNRQVQE